MIRSDKEGAAPTVFKVKPSDLVRKSLNRMINRSTARLLSVGSIEIPGYGEVSDNCTWEKTNITEDDAVTISIGSGITASGSNSAGTTNAEHLMSD